MSGFFKNIFNRVEDEDMDYTDQGYEDFYEGNQDDLPIQNHSYHEKPVFTRQSENPNKVLKMQPHVKPKNQVLLIEPVDIDAAQQCIDYILSNKTVVCNIEKIEPRIAQRVIDYITGAAYALGGQIMPVSSVIFIVAPKSTQVMEAGEEDNNDHQLLSRLVQER